MQPDVAATGASTSRARALWRQDDNGNRVRIETFGTREAAQARQAEFESRHHKQIYWVEQA
jgi:ribose 5-phosphate isomerase B